MGEGVTEKMKNGLYFGGYNSNVTGCSASVERAKLQQGILIFLKLTNNQNIDMREHML